MLYNFISKDKGPIATCVESVIKKHVGKAIEGDQEETEKSCYDEKQSLNQDHWTDLKKRAEQKGSLYGQVQQTLSGPTGAVAEWGRLAKGIEEGNISAFLTHGYAFLQDMEKASALFEEFQNIIPLETDPRDSIMTAQLNGRFEDERLLLEYENKAKELKESRLLEKQTIDPDILQGWYRQKFGENGV